MFVLFSTEIYLVVSNTCYGNNTVFNKEDIDNGTESGITCFRKGSMSTNGTLMNQDGESVACDRGVVQCVIENGSFTFYTLSDFEPTNNGSYTCCIDGSGISARILTNNSYNDFFNSCELLEAKYITYNNIILQHRSISIITASLYLTFLKLYYLLF